MTRLHPPSLDGAVLILALYADGHGEVQTNLTDDAAVDALRQAVDAIVSGDTAVTR